MKKKCLAIGLSCLVVGVVIAVLVLSRAPSPQCTIDVKATLDGSSWSGNVSYTLTGPGATSPISGTSVDASHSVDCGNWTCAYISGGPAVASFVNITPSSNQTVSAGGAITFTLNFLTPPAAVLDHFKCYWVEQGASVNVDVQLEDQFGSVEATVTDPVWFCNPVEKTHDGEVTEIESPDHHLTVYSLDHEEELQKLVVEVDNQFGEQNLKVQGPVGLAVPTQKEGHDYPEGLDHFLLYYATGPPLNVVVQLEDQFHLEPEVVVLYPTYFANPVQKTLEDGDTFLIESPDEHLVFYEIPEELFQTDVSVVNQFGEQTLSLYGSYLLAVPSEKISFGPPPPLDHFKFYDVVGGPDADVVLPKVGDQFYTGVEEVEVESLRYFGNPVEKTHDGDVTEIGDSDKHLTLYDIATPTTQSWVVEVDNQFGQQELTVSGPVMLAVPTWKEEHGFPMWLDHFLLYKVTEGEDVQGVVDLEDQWHLESDVEVHRPVYFANPAGKVSPYVDWYPGMPLIIENPDEHLVFYEIVGEPYQGDVGILNQFLYEWETISVDDPQFLAVPSEKISFEPVEPEVLDHFKCYRVEGPSIGEVVPKLEDQFGAVEALVEYPEYFCNPAAKTHDSEVIPIWNLDHHLTLYDITTPTIQNWLVEVDNQFGEQELTVFGPVMVAVPTLKEGHGPPLGLDHFLLYEVIEGPDLQVTVDLEDQWHQESDVEVYRPVYFANPAEKTDPHIDAPGNVIPIQHPDEHLVFYEIVGETFQTAVNIVNQFGEQSLSVYEPQLLAVPSEKISFEEVEPESLALDHFLSYWTVEAVPLQAHVYLEDQFCSVDAMVGPPGWFCNPVEKRHEGVVTPVLDSDHHLTVYYLSPEEEPQHWFVDVNNQFGMQELMVSGPVALAVPTQKVEPGDHGPPVGLDHFLLYEVIEGPYFEDLVVGLEDQFHDVAEGMVVAPRYFANPVQKTDDTGMVTEIVNTEAHLVFYEITGGQYYLPQLLVVNQFGQQTFDVAGPILLAVPSGKLSAEQLPPQM